MDFKSGYTIFKIQRGEVLGQYFEYKPGKWLAENVFEGECSCGTEKDCQDWIKESLGLPKLKLREKE